MSHIAQEETTEPLHDDTTLVDRLHEAKRELKGKKVSARKVARALKAKAAEFEAAEAQVEAVRDEVKALKRERRAQEGKSPMKKTLVAGAVAGSAYVAAKKLGLLDER